MLFFKNQLLCINIKNLNEFSSIKKNIMQYHIVIQ